jgi:chaperonin GroES
MIQAANGFVWIIRDETPEETSGLLLPDSGKEKPHYGTLFSVGDMVQDKKIKKGKKCLFFKGNGMEITYEGQDYLVLEGERVIGVI